MAVPSRFFSATRMVVNWRMRETSELRSSVLASLRGRTEGRRASAKGASTASKVSDFASVLVALAKSRTCLGLMITTGSDAAGRAANEGSSKPPEASPGRAEGLEPGDQFIDSRFVIGDCPPLGCRVDRDVQMGLGCVIICSRFLVQ